MDTLYTADEVAMLARLDRQAVYRFARSGALPSVRIGTRIRFPASALSAWIADQIARNTSAAPAAQTQAPASAGPK